MKALFFVLTLLQVFAPGRGSSPHSASALLGQTSWPRCQAQRTGHSLKELAPGAYFWMLQGFRSCSPHFSTVGSPSTYRCCYYLNNLRACRAAVQNSTNIPPVLSLTSESLQQWILLLPNIPHIQMPIFCSPYPIRGKGDKAAFML